MLLFIHFLKYIFEKSKGFVQANDLLLALFHEEYFTNGDRKRINAWK